MAGYVVLLISIVAVASALPADPVIQKLETERYQYVSDADGKSHLVDMWLKASDVQEAARYNPDTQNHYHLFTRNNPGISQPIVNGNQAAVALSNFSPNRRTVLIAHGWMNTATSEIFSVLVPAYLQGEDVNLFVVDWSAGAVTINYAAAVANTVTSGQGVARFVTWLNSVTGATISQYHFIGHGLGGHLVGIAGRNLGGAVPYITGLDPSFTGWITNNNKFAESDGVYTEVIHTNAAGLGYMSPLAHSDFYPNGGINMPGCNSVDCDHARAFHYMGESLRSSGFLGIRCTTYITAMMGNCFGIGGRLRMGGLVPKTGNSGIFFLETNAAPPFSRD